MASGQLKHLHPLAEVFGFVTDDTSKTAIYHRDEKLCPFNNNEAKCTKDKKSAPLGVCSMFHNSGTTIICPIRFRENWIICKDAARFFFKKGTHWSPLKEIRLKEKSSSSAGNIDLVLVAHDAAGKISDFGAVEVQSVYVSGNIRRPFEQYMKDPVKYSNIDWTSETNYPRPDYLSSSRKRLIPQLMYKGRILNAWGKKQSVIIDKPFYETMNLESTGTMSDSDLCWFIYEQKMSSKKRGYNLSLYKEIHEGFEKSMKRIATPEAGDVDEFVSGLEKKLSPLIDSMKKEYGVWSFSQYLDKISSYQSMPEPINDTLGISQRS